jgi:hypothetical protein
LYRSAEAREQLARTLGIPVMKLTFLLERKYGASLLLARELAAATGRPLRVFMDWKRSRNSVWLCAPIESDCPNSPAKLLKLDGHSADPYRTEHRKMLGWAAKARTTASKIWDYRWRRSVPSAKTADLLSAASGIDRAVWLSRESTHAIYCRPPLGGARSRTRRRRNA